jgi:hypothetical protein
MYRSTFFLTSALAGGEWLASRPGPLYPQGKSPRYPEDRSQGRGPRAGLDDVEKTKCFALPGLELRPLSVVQRMRYVRVAVGSGGNQISAPPLSLEFFRKKKYKRRSKCDKY